LSKAKSIGRASSPINELRGDFLQKRYNFDGDADTPHVYGRPNMNFTCAEHSRTIYGVPKRIIKPFNHEKNYKNKGQ